MKCDSLELVRSSAFVDDQKSMCLLDGEQGDAALQEKGCVYGMGAMV